MSPKTFRPIEIRDKRLRGGRMSISPRRFTKAKDRKAIETALRWLLERNELEIIERVRSGQVHLSQLLSAYKREDIDSLRAQLTEEITLRGAVDRHLMAVESGREPGTLRSHRFLSDGLIRKFGGDTSLNDITEDQAFTFLREPKTRNRAWSLSRQQQACAIFARIWKDSIAREAESAARAKVRPRLTRNPWKADSVQVPNARKSRVAFLTPAEWLTLDAALVGQPERIIMALGCLGGLRAMEIAYLRREVDVDLEKRTITVQPRKGEFEWKPKTDRSIRTIPISDELHAIIQDHVRTGYAGERYLIRPPLKDQPMTYAQLRARVRSSFEAAGIKYGATEGDGLTAHSLRHTFASWLVQRDVQLLKVALLMGDRAEEIERTYAHLMPKDLARAVAVQDRILREAKETATSSESSSENAENEGLAR